MKIVLYLVASAIALIGAFFAFNNRAKYLDQIAEFNAAEKARQGIERNITTKEKENALLVQLYESEQETQANLNAQVESEESKQKTAQRSIDKIDKKMTVHDEKIAEAEQLVAQNKANVPHGVTLEELPNYITQLEEKLKTQQTSLDEKKLVLPVLKKRVIQRENESKRLQKTLVASRKRIRENALTATISSVSNEWGFVVISGVGSRNEIITSETELLVNRGNSYIGSLSIASIEPNRIVANINPKSLKSGARIRVGDQVILKAPVSH